MVLGTMMDTVVALAIGVLAAIFLASLVGLIIVCRHKYCRRMDLISRQHKDSRPDVHLVDAMETHPSENPTDVELDDVISPNLEEILQDDHWVEDATGLAPHCIAILKTCHILTEKMVAMTMSHAQQLRSPEALVEIVAVSKRISPRVDDVVKSMYPPLDPRLLEARCTALVLSVTHLVLLTKSACRMSGVLDWIDQSLADVEDHLKVLREASIQYDQCLLNTSGSSDTGNLTITTTTMNNNVTRHVVQVQTENSSQA